MRNSPKDIFEKAMSNNKVTGDFGEKLAEKFLILKGYKILDRNFRVKGGEIDIVAEKNNEVAIVEVKTRNNYAYGDPRDAIDYYKKKHLIFAAQCYIKRHSIYNKTVRFDVIEVMPRSFKINHIKDAFVIDDL